MAADKAQHYAMLLESRKIMLTVVRANATDKTKDKDGSSTDLLALSLRFVGITEFFLENNVSSFRQNLSQSAALRLTLFERFTASGGVDPSFVTMLSHKYLYDGLAAGDLSVSLALAKVMGGRTDIEKEHDHPFDHAMGYALKEAVLGIKNGLGQRGLSEILTISRYSDFQGYGIVFAGINSRDEELVNKGLAAIAKGHVRQSRKGIFKGSEDELLCVWGIGLANLASRQGIKLKASGELIPALLLVQ